MQRTRGGYTIIEVLIVLAVSVVTFFAVITLFAGKQGKTEFSQAMRDVESKIRSIVNDVGVSTFPELPADNTCTIVGGKPTLGSGSTETGTNTGCIFLGKAVELVTNTDPDQLNIHTVLGSRTDSSGATVTNFAGANPEPIDPLAETYNIPWGATILSAHEDVMPDSDTYLMGYFNSLQPVGFSEGSQSLKTIGYVGPNSYGPGLVKTTIEGLNSAVTLRDSKVWTICFQSGTSDEKAELIVNASSAGVTTQIKYTDCSP